MASRAVCQYYTTQWTQSLSFRPDDPVLRVYVEYSHLNCPETISKPLPILPRKNILPFPPFKMLPTQSVVRELGNILATSDLWSTFPGNRRNFMHAVIILLLGLIELQAEVVASRA